MKCIRCGKSLFLQISPDGLCNSCRKREKEQNYQEALIFLSSLADTVKIATEQRTIVPNRSEASLKGQRDACNAVLDYIEQWKSFPEFEKAFSSTVKKVHSFYEHECFPYTSFSKFKNQFEYNEDEIATAFSKLKKDISGIRFDCEMALKKRYDYSEIFFVAGVTFQNGRRERQSILKEIDHHSGKYKSDPDIRLERYQYDGEEAVAVYADSEQVGNIEKSKVPWLIDHWNEYLYVDEYDITGGGDLYYGMQIRACFKKSTSGSEGIV